MIRIFKLLFLLVISQVAFAQAPSNYTNINGRYRWIAGMFDSTFHIPKGTNPSLRTGGSTNAGALFYKTGDSSLYIYTGTQWLKQAGTTGFVPYSGATDTLDMGQFGLKTKFVEFDTSSRAVTDRTLLWSNDDGTLQFGMTNGGTITQRIGLEQFARVKNVDATQINKGDVVYIFGASGDRASVKKADNRQDATSSKTLGVATEDIAVNDVGFVGTFGTVQKLNLAAYTPGDILYVDSIPGQLTNVKPVAPYHMVFVGVVERANAGDGRLFVSVQNGYELEELHNVKITSPVRNNALLVYDSLNSLWVDTTIAQAGLAVTSVATNTGTGITGGTITTSGTLAIDTLLISTRAWRQKGIDSVASLVTSGYVPSSRTITINGTTQDLSANRTYNVGTVTSVATNSGTGITGGTFTTSGTIAADTLLLSTRAWRQKGIDSVASLINTRVSGTTNYIPKFTSSSAIGNSVIYESSSNIGIGTIVPEELLELSSSNTTGGQLLMESTGSATGSYAGMRFKIAGGSDGGYEKAGIFAIRGSGGYNDLSLIFALNTVADATNVTSANEQMRLTSTGLGIGTSSPARKLHVYSGVGTAQIQSSGTSSMMYFGDANSSSIDNQGVGSIGNNIWVMTGGLERLRIDASGNLGLGVTPSAWGSGYKAFDFNTLGTLAASGSAVLLQNNSYNNGTNNIRKAIGEASSYSQNGGAHIWETAAFGSSGSTITFSEVMRIAASGNVGIGVSNPDSYNSNAYKLVVGGLANSGITIAGDASEGSSNLYFADGTTGDQAYRGFLSYTHSNDNLAIGTSGTTRMTITSGGNVGIGVSAPTGTGTPVLHINATTTSELHLTNNTTGTTLTDGFTIQQVGNDSYVWNYENSFLSLGTNNSERMRITSGGSVGIGTTSPANLLTVRGNGNNMISVQYNSDGGAAGIGFLNSSGTELFSIGGGRFQRQDELSISRGGTSVIYINNSNNVGIGTTSPAAKLDVGYVAGAVALRVSRGSSDILDFYQGGGVSYIDASASGGQIAFATVGSERMRITSGGNVGIGTTNPLYKFQVYNSSNGTTVAFGGTAYGLRIDNGGTFSSGRTTIYGVDNSFYGSYQPLSIEASSLVLNAVTGGEVYIAGTTDQGAYNLQVAGTGVWGAGAYVNGSDSSLKENIQNMGSALELVNQLQPKTYTYKPSYSKDTTIQVGFIAQDLEQVLGTQIYKNSIVVDGPNFKSVAYQNLIPLLVQSIKELKAEIETLKNK